MLLETCSRELLQLSGGCAVGLDALTRLDRVKDGIVGTLKEVEANRNDLWWDQVRWGWGGVGAGEGVGWDGMEDWELWGSEMGWGGSGLRWD